MKHTQVKLQKHLEELSNQIKSTDQLIANGEVETAGEGQDKADCSKSAKTSP